MQENNREEAAMSSLHYEDGRWYGANADDTLRIWMSDDTFQRYVTAYIGGRFIISPTPEQQHAAVAHCARLCYWRGCRDCDVHITVVGAANPWENLR
ncbi:MAG: hypothetical protein JO202_07360 [Ktedonobacteraceae bacterium]|nr:hypothetical protein [Ktedonobacteraceae bacterium]